MFVYNPLYHVVGTPYQIFFLGMYSILNFCTIYIVAVNILKEKKKKSCGNLNYQHGNG